MNKRSILVMADWYAPGFKAGGPIRSIVNFADQMESDLDIYVLTTDRDLGDVKPYKDISPDRWFSRSGHRVYYLSPGCLTWLKLKRIIKEISPDIIYLNSMFSRYFTVYPLLMHWFGMKAYKIILAPRGMLRESALEHKSYKKKVFISLLKIIGVAESVVFQATDETENADVKKIFGADAAVFTAGNLPGKQMSLETVIKEKGSLKMIFIGRIHPIKNLDFLLGVLRNMRSVINLTVVATLEDRNYWEKCSEIIRTLPQNVKVDFLENVPHEKIEGLIKSNHIFALPTKGENFGHSIYESLSVGRPVIISDQTPWRDLVTKKAGWDLPIGDQAGFTKAINEALEMDNTTFSTWCKGAWEYARDYFQSDTLRKEYLKQFR